MPLKDRQSMRNFQREMRHQREARSTPELGLKTKPGYVTSEEHTRVIAQLRNELDDLAERLKRVSNLKFNLPQTVQRSVSIPVTVDQGGTGRTDNLVVNIGPSTTNGSWRFSLSGNDLIAERLEAGVWVNKGGFTA